MNPVCDFKIVLLHEDQVSGIRGSTVLERLADQLGLDAAHLDTHVWKFERLGEARSRARAISPLMEAKMIIISAAGDVALPREVRTIIEQALSLRPDREAAIVALLDWETSAGKQLPRVGLYLRNLAARTGMEFFCNKDDENAAPSAGSSGDCSN